jgi:hypothetical protein
LHVRVFVFSSLVRLVVRVRVRVRGAPVKAGMRKQVRRKWR